MPRRRVLFFLLEKIDVGFITRNIDPSSLVLRQHNKGLKEEKKNNYENATILIVQNFTNGCLCRCYLKTFIKFKCDDLDLLMASNQNSLPEIARNFAQLLPLLAQLNCTELRYNCTQ